MNQLNQTSRSILKTNNYPKKIASSRNESFATFMSRDNKQNKDDTVRSTTASTSHSDHCNNMSPLLKPLDLQSVKAKFNAKQTV
ncbi:hypothetical protein GJ496_009141 [Pomphorhynchus laevis]|nr:hypothetical protein GJ496_009141 [Pomphorhynchus laevis]